MPVASGGESPSADLEPVAAGGIEFDLYLGMLANGPFEDQEVLEFIYWEFDPEHTIHRAVWLYQRFAAGVLSGDAGTLEEGIEDSLDYIQSLDEALVPWTQETGDVGVCAIFLMARTRERFVQRLAEARFPLFDDDPEGAAEFERWLRGLATEHIGHAVELWEAAAALAAVGDVDSACSRAASRSAHHFQEP